MQKGITMFKKQSKSTEHLHANKESNKPKTSDVKSSNG